VPWPPEIGEPLPRADEAFGIEQKLRSYCLNPDHEIGGPKARAFERALGIRPADLDYLTNALEAEARTAPIAAVRDNAPFGVLCEVPIPVAGLRERVDQRLNVTTVWELRHPDDRPRLVTAYIAG
jgi:filamentous hemagglutinin